mmetsp:Transcript_3677/g.4332  ORF Transcript_3677/g.4332 Transcript_3677/m.4332 type:complete len:109 (-) Transcript_3677:77-403(-)
MWRSDFYRDVKSSDSDTGVDNYLDLGSNSDIVLDVDTYSYFDKAESLFKKIVPDGEFLVKQERNRDLSVPKDNDEDILDLLSRTAVPVPVDLRYFVWLGGKVDDSEET